MTSSPYHGEDNTGSSTKEKESTEMLFKNVDIPKWNEQITVRAIIASLILSILVIFLVMSCSLTTGMVPTFNAAAGLLGFAMLKTYTVVLGKLGLLKQPFTRQENTIVQTCVIAAGGISFTGGMTTYLLGMSSTISSSMDTGGAVPANVKNMHFGWVIGFLFSVSFIGLFVIVPLRKMMIVNFKLPYPSGTATACLINSFHTPKGGKLAIKQVGALLKSFAGSFFFASFKWLYQSQDGCGFDHFPVFGLKAASQKWFLDFGTTYIGVGMICPYMVSVSLMVGAIISWGIMWPWIEGKKGDWYPATGLNPSSLEGIQGYRVFLAIAMVLGDGLFQCVFITTVTIRGLIADKMCGKQEVSSLIEDEDDESDDSNGKVSNYDDKRRIEYFLKDSIPNVWALGGYFLLAIIGIIFVPAIFSYRIKWYHIVFGYVVAPVMALSNAYGVGLTDVSLAQNYGKMATLVFSSWVGMQNGGIIAGLAGTGIIMNIVFAAGELMNDFKTGYLTLTSPRSMFISQIFGTAIGCILSPLIYKVIASTYVIGDPNGKFPAPLAQVFRGMALLGVKGFSALPKNCLRLAVWCFIFAIAINLLTQILIRCETKYRIHRFIPNPMCMALPFYLGGYLAIDMCIGSFIAYIWRTKNSKSAAKFSMVVAAGLMCGEAFFGIPSGILAALKVSSPMCMAFFKAADYKKVSALLPPH